MSRRLVYEFLVELVLTLTAVFLFRLQLPGVVIVSVGGMGTLAFCERQFRKEDFLRKEYYQVTTYMEQLICSYKRHGVIIRAMEDCGALFEKEERMGQVLLAVKERLENGEEVRECLSLADSLFDSRRLHLLHDFLHHFDKWGSEMQNELDILLNDLEMWKNRVVLYQKKKQFIRKESILAGIFSLFLCYGVSLLMPFSLREEFWNGAWYQWSTTIMLLLLMVSELMIVKVLTGAWLDSGQMKKIKGKMTEEYIKQEFPYWLLTVSLYLQHDSVFLAIKNSLSHVKGKFCDEVKRLLEQIYENPSSVQPYNDFLHQWEIPEVQTGMKILYSVNEGGFQSVKQQVRFLVEQNHLLMDKNDRNSRKNSIAIMRMLRQIPMLLAGAKIVLDMMAVVTIMMKGWGYV